jgi:hypothetical protein
MEEEARVCRKCGIEQPIRNFRINKSKNGSFPRYACKGCENIRYLELKKLDPEKYKEISRKNHQKRREKERAWNREYREKNRAQILSRSRPKAKEKYKKNKVLISERNKEWRIKNLERAKLGARQRYARNKNNAQYKINRAISGLVRYSLKVHGGNKSRRKWETLVGYTTEDLVAHLEKQFTEGMSWDNYGKWHIDHIMPQSVFNFTDASHIDFKKCWALSNLRPLWEKENLIKNNKLYQPFQPSLAF